MIFERYITSEIKNDAYRAIYEMIKDTDKGISYADMMRLRISGAVSKECHDVYYVAYEKDVAIARHWNGWGKHRDAIGNWGNFFVNERYRGQGIGGKLLGFWWEDFSSYEERPLCFLCSAATKELTDLYSRFGFRPAIKGTDHGPLYMPIGNSPDSFDDFLESYYRESSVLIHKPASAEYRHEIDCLLRFAFYNRGESFEIDGISSFEEALLTYPTRTGILFSEDLHAVGWSFDGKIQVHPLYSTLVVKEL